MIAENELEKGQDLVLLNELNTDGKSDRCSITDHLAFLDQIFDLQDPTDNCSTRNENSRG